MSYLNILKSLNIKLSCSLHWWIITLFSAYFIIYFLLIQVCKLLKLNSPSLPFPSWFRYQHRFLLSHKVLTSNGLLFIIGNSRSSYMAKINAAKSFFYGFWYCLIFIFSQWQHNTVSNLWFPIYWSFTRKISPYVYILFWISAAWKFNIIHTFNMKGSIAQILFNLQPQLICVEDKPWITITVFEYNVLNHLQPLSPLILLSTKFITEHGNFWSVFMLQKERVGLNLLVLLHNGTSGRLCLKYFSWIWVLYMKYSK